MAGMTLYTLRESPAYTAQMATIGQVKHVDAALSVLTWAICESPEKFPFVPGFQPVRMAKTDKYLRDSVEIPPLRLWFKIENANVIELLSIEPVRS